MRKLRGYIIIAVIAAKCSIAMGQDPQFSQFFSNPLYLAPSFAGLIADTRVTGNYRVQWPDLPKPFLTYSFALDHNFAEFSSGAGIFVMRDMAGTGSLTNSLISLQYAYEFSISKYWFVRPGLEFKYSERRLDFSALLWADQISATGNRNASSELPPFDNVGDIDFGTSVMAYSDRFWLGFGLDHLLKPNQSLYSYDGYDATAGYVPLKYTLFGGTKIINKGRLLNPYDASLQLAALYRNQEGFNQMDVGLYWYNKPLVLGIWYRGMFKKGEKLSRDAIILLTGLKLDWINIGYSYDFTISRLIGSTHGAHEFSLSYAFNTKVQAKRMRSVPCPDF
jgi:type IX secretion system PorP/SprF family membrane protein